MTPHIPKNVSVVDWSLVTIMGDMLPPRDPNDDDEDEEDEEDEDKDEDKDKDKEEEPAVIREPDNGE
jgi:hypothetical protein